MKIVVLGTRGFPDVQGGVEAHCKNLYPQLVKLGCEVIVFGRAPYIGNKPYEYKDIKIIPISCPKNKFFEAIAHTLKGIFAAKRLKPDILHVHAIGPSLVIPFARLLGLKAIMTHHGHDYERKKWGTLAKISLKTGEWLGAKYANGVICISRPIADEVRKKYGREAAVIPNGVDIPEIIGTDNFLRRFGLDKGKYILAVGRFVPEKGFHDLLEAYKMSQNHNVTKPQIKLVIAGDADHEDKYSIELKRKAKETPGVVLTGFLTGHPLQELYSHAGLFILPSYHEGLPIVLLEAMSYGLSCIVSDIPANRGVGIPDNRYFKPGYIAKMAGKIRHFIAKPLSAAEKQEQISLIQQCYNWRSIAEKTVDLYKSV